MKEKLLNLNWSTYNSVLLIIANVLIVLVTSKIVMNTKEMANSELAISYLVLGLVVIGLVKLNNASTSRNSVN